MQTKIWVLVGDGVHAQLYAVRTMRPLRIEKLPGGHFRGRGEARPHTDHSGAAASFRDEGGARHHIGRHPDPHRVDKEIFIEHLGDFISRAGEHKDFDELVVVAPNHALGELRRSLAPAIQDKIKIELDGEWTKLSHTALEQHLASCIPAATI